MPTEPVEAKLKASDAVALVDLIFHAVDGRDIDGELRDSLAARSSSAQDSIVVHWGSLQKDPRQSSAYYVAVDTRQSGKTIPLLLHMALASSPEASIFNGEVLVGRLRPGGGREVLVSTIPFASTDYENIRRFAGSVDPHFLPRPQRDRSAIAAGNRHPEISLPAVFKGFRTILETTQQNLASTVQLSATREMTTTAAIERRQGENPTEAGHTRVSIQHLYHAGVWAAIRAGWREGYNAEADHVIITGATGDAIAASVEAGKEAIREAAGYTKFTTDTSRLFELRADTRHPQAWSDSEVESALTQSIAPDISAWAIEEFSRKFDTGDKIYAFTVSGIRRLLVKFGRSLLLNEELYDHIKQQKRTSAASDDFDFEPSIDEAETLTTPQEMLFYMHWLSKRGRPAQLVPPNLGFKKRQAYPETAEALAKYSHHKMWPELGAAVAGYGNKPIVELASRVAELASIARYFDGTLSIHSGSGKQPEVLKHIGRSTRGRFNYKISGELQLQLFDVLSEQPATSSWRQLYDRMVARCLAFAERTAFGEESELAKIYSGSSLGNAQKGRGDGNLFLVFWLGNLVGSRDLYAPDGDKRFFNEKLNELPEDLLREVRRRNADYVVWLASHLQG